MKLIKDLMVAAWVFFVGMLYFILLFFMGIGILITEASKDFFKKNA